MEENIIIRTEKIREIGEALKTKNILYISAFYGSGKTVLLDQTVAVAAEEWGRNVIRFDAAYNKWETFTWKLSEFLRNLPETAQAILCGRAKVPEKMTGAFSVTPLSSLKI
ncbi:MAG: hypothetical protein J6N15_10715 [Ruminiclostridium sp.]|nr:hypothetical protein [Ruminiclostridium sp.]